MAKCALQFPKLLLLEDFNVHADTVSIQVSDLVSSMAALGLSQFVSGLIYQAGCNEDLIFDMGMDVELTSREKDFEGLLGFFCPLLSRQQADLCSPEKTSGPSWIPECSVGSKAPRHLI